MASRFPMSVVEWLREGYPAGIPPQDTIPILALLRRRLTDDEVAEIAAELRSQGLMEVARADIGAEITKVTDELPRDEDLQRVADHLVFRGFPVIDHDPADTNGASTNGASTNGTDTNGTDTNPG